MRSALTCAIAAWALLTTLSGAATGQCLPIAVGNPDGNYLVPGVRGDIVYRRVNGAPLALDAYVQQTGNRRPAIIVVHGGNWDTGSRIAFTGQFLELLTRAGYNWFAVDYRANGLARFTDAVDDLRAAVEFVRCHAGEFRIDPDNVAVLGEDSGAHLAVSLAAGAPSGVRAVVSIGGFYDRGGVPALNLQRMPPLLVIHGSGDTESPLSQADAFCDTVGRAGRSCELLAVEDAIHRPENWRPSQWGYKSRLTAWLGQTLGLSAANHTPYVTRLQKEIVFSPAHGLTLDAWTPPGPGPFPAVIIAHGGGWEAGDRVTYVTPVFEPLAKRRLRMVLDRLPPDTRVPQPGSTRRSSSRCPVREGQRGTVSDRPTPDRDSWRVGERPDGRPVGHRSHRRSRRRRVVLRGV